MRIVLLSLLMLGLLAASFLLALRPEKSLAEVRSAKSIQDALWEKEPFRTIMLATGPRLYLSTKGGVFIFRGGSSRYSVVTTSPGSRVLVRVRNGVKIPPPKP
jgi:hypothetical protein